MADKPKLEIRSGAIRLAVWENTKTNRKGEEYTAVSAKLERCYRDDNGNWQNSNTFTRRDLLDVALLCRRAYEVLSIKERQPTETT